MPRRILLAGAIALSLALPGLAWGHAERPTLSPARPGTVPNPNRVPTAILDVCKTGECLVEHIQAAVFAAPEGALVRIWPGLYKEEPSLAQPHVDPDNPDGTYSYEHHIAHPNSQNLIAIVGKKNLTLRGMGASPRDVVIDVAFRKHVGIRGDRADGIIIENLSVWHAYDHGIYILDTDGFVIDGVHSGYSREYPFLTFADDHGLMKNCEAFGGGDAGLYPGGAADAPDGKLGRYSMEISHCRSYHNVLGYSGTQSNNVWVHDSEFFDNAVGLVSDSETNHPNYPQNNLVLERNKFYDNDFNVYSPDSDIAPTVFSGFAAIPVGIGVLLATGNDNLVQNNDIWGNDRYGVALWSGEGLVLGPISDPPAPPFASTGNRFLANRMYGPAGSEPNGYDFAWDGYGTNNCWESNVRADGAPATSEVLPLPPCNNPVDGSALPVTAGPPNPVTTYVQASILVVADTDGDGVDDRPICDFTETCGYDWQSSGPASEDARNLPEGYQPPPTPPTCGPSTCPASSSGSTVLQAKFSVTFRAKASTLPATGVPAATTAALAFLGSAVLIGARIRRRT